MDDDQIAPEVGMGCTTGYGSDCYPHTIVKLYRTKDGRLKAFDMQEDIAIRTDDRGYYTESQDYKYLRDPFAPTTHVTLRSDGKWKVAGDTRPVHVGHRRRYNDPSY